MWFVLRTSGVRVLFIKLLKMRLCGTPIDDVVRGCILVHKAQLAVSIDELESVVVSGSNIQHVVLEMVVATQIGKELTLSDICGFR